MNFRSRSGRAAALFLALTAAVLMAVPAFATYGYGWCMHTYFNLTQAYHIFPSMSRRGNPYDNALAENFFSILKTECIHLTKLRTFAEAKQVIDEYIYFYHYVRLQSKTKLTPAEFRNQFCA